MFIFFDDLLDRIGIFLPDLFGDEWRISQDEIKIVVVFFRNELMVVKVILKEVRIIDSKFLIVLGRFTCTSNRMIGR
jgi:hypothetical protein